jgi:DNA-binding CsgD family transcriptional regulator/tetratricopeptide (TPR) repeat protein
VGAGHDLLRDAQAALGAGDVPGAWAAVDQALAADDLPEAHQLRAGLLMLDDRLDEACRERELAFRGHRDRGDLRAASRAAIDLAHLQEGLLGNRAAGSGWLERARRLLTEVGPCVEWGYLELAFLACYREDVEELTASADRALAIAVQFGDRALEALALADGGLGLVTSGRVRDGFRRLDEAMAIVTAGEVDDPGTAGLSFCSMLSSCDLVGDVARVDEWTRVVRSAIVDPLGGRPRVLHTHCLLALGSVLSRAGRWREAEGVMLEALGPTGSRSSGHRAATSAHLAALRIDQGRLAEAAELLAPWEDQISACLPLARLQLARDEPELAAAVARRGLRRLRGDALRTAPLLSTLVEAELRTGDLDAADRAAAELATVAGRAESSELAAAATLARGRVQAARADHRAAVESFESVAECLDGDDRPGLRAEMHLALAASLTALDDRAAAVVEARAAKAVFERLGSSRGVDRAAAQLRVLGAPSRSRPAGDAATVGGSLSGRELDVLELLREGLTNAEIGARLFISPKTAEHHVSRVLAKLGVRSRTEAAGVAAALLATRDR